MLKAYLIAAGATAIFTGIGIVIAKQLSKGEGTMSVMGSITGNPVKKQGRENLKCMEKCKKAGYDLESCKQICLTLNGIWNEEEAARIHAGLDALKPR